jgi:NAD(P)-dependent dehydrogenase (short-subunit alcohol dehydrogenase family)
MTGAIAVLGATGGLGEVIVRRLAATRPVLVGYHSNVAKATALVEEVQRAGGTAWSLPIDIADGEAVASFFRSATDLTGGIDHVVSATGPAIPLCPLLEVSEQDFRRIMDTDVTGTFNLLRYAIPALEARGGGSITIFVTTAVLRTLENDGMSSVPKTAVTGLVRLAAREAGPKNVRCNAVAPGVIDAGIVHSSFVVSEVAKQVIADCLDRTPMGRMGKPGEVAGLVEFLCSDAAAYINGQVIGIDGGYSA